MTTFLQPDEAGIGVDFAESRTKRGRDCVACFLHLRDLVYLHPKAASADAITFVQSLDCPSSDDLRHIAGLPKGGSGSSVIEIMRHSVDAASEGLRLSGA